MKRIFHGLSRTVFLGLMVMLISCSGGQQGALEVAWVIRGLDQHAYTCREPGFEISSIRLVVEPEGQSGHDLCSDGTVSGCRFECPPDTTSTMRGMTTFSVPPGRYYVWCVPLDEHGDAISDDKVQTPYPVAVTVESGRARFLGVWQLIISKR